MQDLGAALVLVDDDVVALGCRGPVAVDATGLEAAFSDDLLQEFVAVLEELPCSGPVLLVIQDPGVAPLELPGREEECPVDVGDELGDRNLDLATAQERGSGNCLLYTSDAADE